MKKHIKNYHLFINENKKTITYINKCLGNYDQQSDMECSIYEGDQNIGLIQYTLYNKELSIKNIIIIPERTLQGFESLLISYIIKENPDYTCPISSKNTLGHKITHNQINESLTDNVNIELYHGTLGDIKSFRNRTTYFCDNPSFCYDYASTKAIDRGIDLSATVYKCEFTGKLFSYNNEKDMNNLISFLPNEVKINHGTMWFLDKQFSKKELIKRLKGISTIEPIDYIVDANIGDEIPNPQYKQEIFIVVEKDDNNVYTIDKKTYNDYLDSSLNGHSKYRSELTKYKSIFDSWRKIIIDTYNKNTNSNKVLSNYNKEEFDNYTNTLDMSKKGYNIDYINTHNNKDDILFTKDDIKKIDDAYIICLQDFKKTAYTELYRTEWNCKTIEEKMDDNWNYYENEVVANIIKMWGYDGYVAKEKGHNTYAIYEPMKSIKILGKK